MKIYTVYAKPSSRNHVEDTEFVPEAFSWRGFLLFYHVLWPLCIKSWAFVAMLLAFYAAFFLSTTYLQEYKEITENIARVGFVSFGLFANDLWRASLERRGYIFRQVIAARDEEEASYKYFSNRHD